MEIVTNMTQDRENLYSVVSHVTVTEGEDNGDISCIVRNGLLQTERQSAIHLSGDIFPQVSPWLAAFWVLFTLVLIAAGACAYLGYTAKRKASQKKPSKEEALLNLDIEKTTLDAERQELRETLASKEKKNKELESAEETTPVGLKHHRLQPAWGPHTQVETTPVGLKHPRLQPARGPHTQIVIQEDSRSYT
ncbi:unnamed protein product [Natator depressus]